MMHSITAAEFRLWLNHSRPGERIHYFKGHLAYDREGIINMLTAPKHVRFEPQNSLADEAYKASQRGMVHLYQFRIGPNEFDYIAERRPTTQRRHTHG